MAVFRIQKTENYTVMSNTHFKDRRLSLKAMGILSLMLSLPDNWDYSVAGLAAIVSDGRDSINKALSELEKYGYLERVRVTNEKGQFAGYDYNVYEVPKTEKPYTENPYTENPKTEKPFTENPEQLNTNTSNTKKSNTKKTSIKAFTPPTVEEVAAYCRERNNGINPESFVDYYESNGWMVGRNKMKDWKAAVRTWERNSYSGQKQQKPQTPNATLYAGVERISTDEFI